MNASVRRRLRRVVTPHASARARERARETSARARLEITRNQNALKTHSKRTRTRTRARTRDARMTLESIRSPPAARSRFQPPRETRNRSKCESNGMRIRFDSIRIRPAFVAVAFVFVVERRAVGRPRRRPRRHLFRTVARAHTHATRADAPAHLDAWERRDMSRVMTHQIRRVGSGSRAGRGGCVGCRV